MIGYVSFGIQTESGAALSQRSSQGPAYRFWRFFRKAHLLEVEAELSAAPEGTRGLAVGDLSDETRPLGNRDGFVLVEDRLDDEGLDRVADLCRFRAERGGEDGVDHPAGFLLGGRVSGSRCRLILRSVFGLVFFAGLCGFPRARQRGWIHRAECCEQQRLVELKAPGGIGRDALGVVGQLTVEHALCPAAKTGSGEELDGIVDALFGHDPGASDKRAVLGAAGLKLDHGQAVRGHSGRDGNRAVEGGDGVKLDDGQMERGEVAVEARPETSGVVWDQLLNVTFEESSGG
uniref:Uncharacterized protein n=1 Tax=mine drainage metagenome TaxID=410659 RepID=E6PYE8_9ZZZZ